MWILIDERTGLHVAWYFWLRVLDEVNRSTRYGTPFALLLLEGEIEEPTGRSRQLDDSASDRATGDPQHRPRRHDRARAGWPCF